MHDDWPLLETTPLGDFRVLSLHRDVRRHPGRGASHTFYRLHATDWVNVVPLTPGGGEVVLIRQFRAGIGAETWEIPGGMVDPGEAPGAAALRELREETGFVGAAAEELGWVHPNPALFDNRCWTYLARDVVRAAPPQLDDGEVIAVEVVPLAEIPGFIRAGRITHALVIAAFHRLFAR
jgi:8-oxo-dGTP pyrophosphatase MutT (NUDIX family)